MSANRRLAVERRRQVEVASEEAAAALDATEFAYENNKANAVRSAADRQRKLADENVRCVLRIVDTAETVSARSLQVDRRKAVVAEQKRIDAEFDADDQRQIAAANARSAAEAQRALERRRIAADVIRVQLAESAARKAAAAAEVVADGERLRVVQLQLDREHEQSELARLQRRAAAISEFRESNAEVIALRAKSAAADAAELARINEIAIERDRVEAERRAAEADRERRRCERAEHIMSIMGASLKRRQMAEAEMLLKAEIARQKSVERSVAAAKQANAARLEDLIVSRSQQIARRAEEKRAESEADREYARSIKQSADEAIRAEDASRVLRRQQNERSAVDLRQQMSEKQQRAMAVIKADLAAAAANKVADERSIAAFDAFVAEQIVKAESEDVDAHFVRIHAENVRRQMLKIV